VSTLLLALQQAMMAAKESAPATIVWTQWDATRKSGAAALSDLQVTFTGQGAAAADMHVDAATADRYWEVSIDSITGNVPGVGMVREDYTDWTGVTGYSSIGAFAYNADGSFDWWVSGGSANETTAGETFGAGDTVACRLKNGKFYIGIAAAGAVTWFNSGDPDAETGAILSGITGRYSPATAAYSSGTRVMTANFGATAWVGEASGYAIGWPHAPTLGAHTMYKGEDFNTATPVVTSAIATRNGSSFLVSRGAFATVTNAPTDNKSNTFTLNASADYAGYSGTFNACNFLAENGFGGAGHTVTLDNSAASTREVTLAFIEVVKDGDSIHVEDVSYTYPADGSTNASAAVTTTGPALLVAIWTGDAGGLTHTAVPSAGWHVIESFLSLPAGSAVQYAIAVREVDAAGSYDVSWAVTPDQSSPLWIYAFQSGDAVPVPMTLVGTLPDAFAGVPYSKTLAIEGDYVEPVTMDTSSGTMPAWITSVTVDGRNVTYSGTPETEAATVSFTARATDSSSTPQVATSAQSIAVLAASFTAWDAANDTVYGISFSNGDLTATVAGDNKGTRALASCTIDVAGAHNYYELHVDSVTASTTYYAGYATSAWTKDSPPGTGYASPANAFSVSSTGTMYLSQSNVGNCGQTFAAGDYMLLYLAAGGGVYIGRKRSDTTTWASGHDPNTSGDTPNYTLPAGTWGPACGADASGSKSAVLTANFGASAWASTPPTGATGWVG
jgi:hypothetical protein